MLIIISCAMMLSYATTRKTLSKSIGKNHLNHEELLIKQDKDSGTIAVYKRLQNIPILTQVAKENQRPFIHPIVAPDGRGVLTQYRPAHHPHQTGLYWGLKMVNGRDYFMNWQKDYWQKVSDSVLTQKGPTVQWKTVYDLLDEKGKTCLTEEAQWTLQIKDSKYWIDLIWKGHARTDITVGKFYVGGLFLRMPWSKEIKGEVLNANGLYNGEAEGQRANWADVGMAIEGRNDWGHVAIFDHPQNKSFPTPWRVDNELGIGPSRQITGDWKLQKGETEVIRYRLIVYTGNADHEELVRLWEIFSLTD